MSSYKEMFEFAAALDLKMAIVQVQRGESNKDAWTRHLKAHPHDANAMIKVFNQPETITPKKQLPSHVGTGRQICHQGKG